MASGPATAPDSSPTARVLFLDDDPARAESFLADCPEAVWVQTVVACLGRLEEEWDEVHLDHDLGGEVYVDLHRDDCGMEVVRWLCLEPRAHLRRARFFVHSHNANAAALMVMQLQVAGYQVESRPFGTPSQRPPRREPPGVLDWFRGLLGRAPEPAEE